jgi:hypothetical protein
MVPTPHHPPGHRPLPRRRASGVPATVDPTESSAEVGRSPERRYSIDPTVEYRVSCTFTGCPYVDLARGARRAGDLLQAHTEEHPGHRPVANPTRPRETYRP